MPDTEEKALAWVLRDVNQRAAALSEREDDRRLMPLNSDQDKLTKYFDGAVLKLAAATGNVKHIDFPATTVSTTNIDPEVTTDSTSDNMDPITGPAEMVSMELWQALSYYVLSQWFESIGAFKLAEFFEGKYLSERAEHRFTPTMRKTAERPFRDY